jgi:hypothetical protein
MKGGDKMGNNVQRWHENKEALADPIKRERYKKIYKEILGIFAENECTASEAFNILLNLRKGIDAAETAHSLGIDEDVLVLFRQ